MTDEDDLVLLQVLAEVLRELDAVGDHTLDGEHRRARGAVLTQGPAGAALIPLHDGEVP